MNLVIGLFVFAIVSALFIIHEFGLFLEKKVNEFLENLHV